MTRLTTLIIAFIITINCAWSQNDSVRFVQAKWSVKKIARGVEYKTVHFDSTLFNSNQNISIVSVKKRKPIFGIALERKQLKITSQFGKEQQALAAINGTFFDMKNGGSVDYLRLNTETINENTLTKSGARTVHQKAAVIIHKGKLSLAKWDATSDWEKKIEGEEVMNSGPLLIYKNKKEKLDSSNFTFTRHPRSAIAVTKSRVLLITIDGRHKQAAGMNLYELQSAMRWLGAQDAINLDGGGSTTLWIDGEGVVNYPSDNKKWDHEGERAVANVVIVRKSKSKH